MLKGQIGDVEKAVAIATTFGAIGRAGECSFLTYDQAEWNFVYDILVLDWNEVKTDKQVPMPFSHDYNDFSLCFYYMNFCYHLYDGGSRATTTQSFTSSVVERGLDPDDTSLIYPFLLTNAPQKVYTFLKVYLLRKMYDTNIIYVTYIIDSQKFILYKLYNSNTVRNV